MNGQINWWGKHHSFDYVSTYGCKIEYNFVMCGEEWITCVYEPISTPPPSQVPSPPSAFSSDVGDAPDSSNDYGDTTMTAYPGVTAHFPTVFGAGSPPYGPKHENLLAVAGWLGPAITGEDEADKGPDADPTNNIIPATNQADKDGADDGVALPIPMQHCQGGTLQFTVAIPEGASQVDWVVNAWFDWNRNGTWGDILSCDGGESAPEWAVRNLKLGKLEPGYHIIETSFLPYNPDPTKPMWMRITLSEQDAPSADGAGLAAGYRFGETEDYYLTSFGTWSSPDIAAGENYERTFPQMGNYPYFDRRHPDRRGLIRVRPEAISTASREQSPVEVSITETGFDPFVVTVGISDTVRWTNNDQSDHAVTGGVISPLYIPLLLH